MVVTFSRTRTVRLVPKVKPSERDRVWWNAGELKRIKSQCIHTLRLGESIKSCPKISNSYCIRGLEGWGASKKNIARRKYVRDSRILVLQEQECKEYAGIKDSFAYASAYAKASLEARRQAHFRGLEDERQALLQHNIDGMMTSTIPCKNGKRAFEDSWKDEHYLHGTEIMAKRRLRTTLQIQNEV